MEKALFSWSGGKDGAMALYEVLKAAEYQISAIVTTVTECYDRVSMHGIRRAVLEKQAASLGIPLEVVLISNRASDEEYETKMGDLLRRYQAAGVTAVIFGDIFLEDLRRYRENNLAEVGLQGVFPLWKRDTRELARSLTALGFRAITTCVDTQKLDGRFVGRVIDEQFLADLPEGVDPCGENGEFHSCVVDGPIFKTPIPCSLGETVLRENRFCFCDLVPS